MGEDILKGTICERVRIRNTKRICDGKIHQISIVVDWKFEEEKKMKDWVRLSGTLGGFKVMKEYNADFLFEFIHDVC